MRIPTLSLLALASCYCSALAFDLQGRIQWNDICPSLRELGQASVVLDNGRHRGGVTRDGGFTIYDAPNGTYVLSVVAHDHAFDKLRVTIPVSSSDTPDIRPYVPGTPLLPPAPIALPYPIVLQARQRADYFVKPDAFDVLAMFKNPMMLMMVFGGVMVFAMPYLMKNMDPETLQEIQGRQARMAGIQSSLQSGDLRSGLSELLNAGEDKPAAAASGTKAAASPAGARNRKGQRKR